MKGVVGVTKLWVEDGKRGEVYIVSTDEKIRAVRKGEVDRIAVVVIVDTICCVIEEEKLVERGVFSERVARLDRILVVDIFFLVMEVTDLGD